MNSSLGTRLGDELRELASRQPFVPDIDAIGRRARQRHRRGRALRGATVAGAGIGAVAAGVAVVLAASSTPRPAPGTGSATRPPAVHARLASLAADIQARGGQQPGSAWLIIRTQAIGSRQPYVTYNLYTASGAIYVTDTRSQLRRAIARHQDLADGSEARQMAAARYAATAVLVAAPTVRAVPPAGMARTAVRARTALPRRSPGHAMIPFQAACTRSSQAWYRGFHNGQIKFRGCGQDCGGRG